MGKENASHQFEILIRNLTFFLKKRESILYFFPVCNNFTVDYTANIFTCANQTAYATDSSGAVFKACSNTAFRPLEAKPREVASLHKV